MVDIRPPPFPPHPVATPAGTAFSASPLYLNSPPEAVNQFVWVFHLDLAPQGRHVSRAVDHADSRPYGLAQKQKINKLVSI